jgi:hypothetical protein
MDSAILVLQGALVLAAVRTFPSLGGTTHRVSSSSDWQREHCIVAAGLRGCDTFGHRDRHGDRGFDMGWTGAKTVSWEEDTDARDSIGVIQVDGADGREERLVDVTLTMTWAGNECFSPFDAKFFMACKAETMQHCVRWLLAEHFCLL